MLNEHTQQEPRLEREISEGTVLDRLVHDLNETYTHQVSSILEAKDTEQVTALEFLNIQDKNSLIKLEKYGYDPKLRALFMWIDKIFIKAKDPAFLFYPSSFDIIATATREVLNGLLEHIQKNGDQAPKDIVVLIEELARLHNEIGLLSNMNVSIIARNTASIRDELLSLYTQVAQLCSTVEAQNYQVLTNRELSLRYIRPDLYTLLLGYGYNEKYPEIEKLNSFFSANSSNTVSLLLEKLGQEQPEAAQAWKSVFTSPEETDQKLEPLERDNLQQWLSEWRSGTQAFIQQLADTLQLKSFNYSINEAESLIRTMAAYEKVNERQMLLFVLEYSITETLKVSERAFKDAQAVKDGLTYLFEKYNRYLLTALVLGVPCSELGPISTRQQQMSKELVLLIRQAAKKHRDTAQKSNLDDLTEKFTLLEQTAGEYLNAVSFLFETTKAPPIIYPYSNYLQEY